MPLPGGIEGAWGRVGVHLTKQQPDPQADDMSCWPAVVPLLTTRCLNWGWVLGASRGCGGIRGMAGVKEASGGHGLDMKNEDSLLQSTLKNSIYIWAQVNLTYVSTILGHQMPLLGYIWAQGKWTYASTILGHQVPLLGVHLSSG